MSWFDKLAKRYLRYRQSDWGKVLADWKRATRYWANRWFGAPTTPPADRVEQYLRDREDRKDHPPEDYWPK
jgi:hypothetical protein